MLIYLMVLVYFVVGNNVGLIEVLEGFYLDKIFFSIMGVYRFFFLEFVRDIEGMLILCILLRESFIKFLWCKIILLKYS